MPNRVSQPQAKPGSTTTGQARYQNHRPNQVPKPQAKPGTKTTDQAREQNHEPSQVPYSFSFSYSSSAASERANGLGLCCHLQGAVSAVWVHVSVQCCRTRIVDIATIVSSNAALAVLLRGMAAMSRPTWCRWLRLRLRLLPAPLACGSRGARMKSLIQCLGATAAALTLMAWDAAIIFKLHES